MSHYTGELLRQFKSPVILLLLFAAALSAVLRDMGDAAIIAAIVVVSGLLGFWQEHHASRALERLLAMVKVCATVVRDGQTVEIPVEKVVPGDVAVFNAGDLIPGDCVIFESKNLFVDESALTGEPYPVEKMAGPSDVDAPLGDRKNALWMGGHVVSGSARAVVARTGSNTEFGKLSAKLKLRPEETEFERGIRRFGYFLLELTLTLVIAIFAINVHFQRPVLDSFLFALALAVGLTPQLLPAVISVNLAYGARALASRKVIVKRLAAIENLGSMNVFCCDKTGTLTRGKIELKAAVGINGQPSARVLRAAALNSTFQMGFSNPIDDAIGASGVDLNNATRLDEVPYDFARKRLSVLVREQDGSAFLISKGAMPGLIEVCSQMEQADGQPCPMDRAQLLGLADQFSLQGFRVLGVAQREMGSQSGVDVVDERDMVLLGFVLLFDPPKEDAARTIERLKALGVELKIVTGDNALVAENIAKQVGFNHPRILRGADLNRLSDASLRYHAARTQIFAEIEPNAKERVVRSLRRSGNVVGYMGDGINDAAALHSADVGISVEGAVDVAKEAADMVLLEKDLGVLVDGVEQGRRTFANTLKYVFMASSANFGNMFSMAGASLLLPFLPLLPQQILLTNLLTDLPEMTIPTDNVSRELVQTPRRWNLVFIRRFMLTFGLVSSVFDYLTFAILLWLLKAAPEEFRTGWFVESVVSASLIVLVVRTRRAFYRSWPSWPLLLATLSVVVLTMALPYMPFAVLFGFVPLPPAFLAAVLIIALFYIAGAEVTKRYFYFRMAKR